MKPVWIVLGVIVLLVVGVGGMLSSKWNELVTMDTDIKAKWAQVDNQLQRRADLIPNLVETVKGFAGQERAVIDSVTAARAKLAGAGSVPDRMAASPDCWWWSRTIPRSSRMSRLHASWTSWRGPRIACRSSGNDTTMRSRCTTSRCGGFPET
jgi:hypothetical protein